MCSRKLKIENIIIIYRKPLSFRTNARDSLRSEMKFSEVIRDSLFLGILANFMEMPDMMKDIPLSKNIKGAPIKT